MRLLPPLASLLAAAALRATVLTWDTSSSPGWQVGSGGWDQGANWSSDGLVGVGWTPGATAIFHGAVGGMADLIALTSIVSVEGMEFGGDAGLAGAWTLRGGGLALVPGASCMVGPGATVVVESSVKGAAGWRKTGEGTLVLTAMNTLAGFELAGGVLALRNLRALGSGPLSMQDGSLRLEAAGVFYNPVQLEAARTEVAFDLTATDGTPRVAILAGLVSGAGTLVKSGRGDLRLVQMNTFTGGVVVEGGMVSVTIEGSLGVGPVRLAGGGLNFASNVTLANPVALTGMGARLGGEVNAARQSYVAVLAGVVSGPGDLIKVGGGTVWLTAANTYAGGTRLLEGGLIVNGSILGPVRVLGGSLAGRGAVGSVTIAGGGSLSPGEGLGRLRMESLACESGARLVLDLWRQDLQAGIGYDQLLVDDFIDLTGLRSDARATVALTGKLTGFDPARAYRWPVVKYGNLRLATGTVLEDLFQFDLAQLTDTTGRTFDPQTFRLTAEPADQALILSYIPSVPETAGYGPRLCGGLFLLVLVARCRRRFRKHAFV